MALNNPSGSLEGQVAVISGAGGGIGRALAMRFAAEGATLVLSDNHRERLETTASMARDLGARVMHEVLDISDDSAVQHHIDAAIDRYERTDILVSTAAIPWVGSCLEVEADAFRHLLDINLVGNFSLAQACARKMVAQEYGRIIFLGSVNSHVAISNRSIYAAAKGGISMLTKVMAAELGDFGVTVNALAPGPVETDMAEAMHDAKTRQLWLDHLPIRRYATPDDVANAALFLAGPSSGYINGVELPVDAGFTRTGMLIK